MKMEKFTSLPNVAVLTSKSNQNNHSKILGKISKSEGNISSEEYKCESEYNSKGNLQQSAILSISSSSNFSTCSRVRRKPVPVFCSQVDCLVLFYSSHEEDMEEKNQCESLKNELIKLRKLKADRRKTINKINSFVKQLYYLKECSKEVMTESLDTEIKDLLSKKIFITSLISQLNVIHLENFAAIEPNDLETIVSVLQEIDTVLKENFKLIINEDRDFIPKIKETISMLIETSHLCLMLLKDEKQLSKYCENMAVLLHIWLL